MAQYGTGNESVDSGAGFGGGETVMTAKADRGRFWPDRLYWLAVGSGFAQLRGIL